MSALPNLIYIGPDKAGSTWLFGLLNQHQDVFVTPAKDLYFFDRYYHRGMKWYRRQFADGHGYPVISEISHDYLYSEVAARRIQECLPDAQLVVCLREPVERTFSAYLHLLKSGNFTGTFEEALDQHPELIDRSRYGKHMSTYVRYFSREQYHVSVFDDLKENPQRFADKLFDAVDLPRIKLPTKVKQKSLPAGKSRSVLLTQCVRTVGNWLRDIGLPGVVGRVKASKLVQRALYAPYSAAEKPKMLPQTRQRLRKIFAPDIALLDEQLGSDFADRWGYSELCEQSEESEQSEDHQLMACA